jgi:hypothetical protein
MACLNCHEEMTRCNCGSPTTWKNPNVGGIVLSEEAAKEIIKKQAMSDFEKREGG